MTTQQPAQCTEADVRDYMAHIPERLMKCASGEHDWDNGPTKVTGYTRNLRPVPHADINKAHLIELTEGCAVCGLERTSTLVRAERTWTTYTYDKRNPLITSPRGVSETKISVRAEVRFDRKLARALNTGHVLAAAQPAKKSRKRNAA